MNDETALLAIPMDQPKNWPEAKKRRLSMMAPAIDDRPKTHKIRIDFMRSLADRNRYVIDRRSSRAPLTAWRRINEKWPA